MKTIIKLWTVMIGVVAIAVNARAVSGLGISIWAQTWDASSGSLAWNNAVFSSIGNKSTDYGQWLSRTNHGLGFQPGWGGPGAGIAGPTMRVGNVELARPSATGTIQLNATEVGSSWSGYSSGLVNFTGVNEQFWFGGTFLQVSLPGNLSASPELQTPDGGSSLLLLSSSLGLLAVLSWRGIPETLLNVPCQQQ